MQADRYMMLCQLTLWRWQLIPLPTCSIEARQTAKHVQQAVCFVFFLPFFVVFFCVLFCAAAQQKLLTCVLKVSLGVALPVAGRPAVLPRTCCCRCCWALSCWACCSCWAGSRAAAPLASPAACSHQCQSRQNQHSLTQALPSLILLQPTSECSFPPPLPSPTSPSFLTQVTREWYQGVSLACNSTTHEV